MTPTVDMPSRHVCKKFGMTLVDTIPVPPDMQLIEGSDQGGVRYEITEEQWEDLRTS